MEYLKIKNVGTLDLRSFFLIGASTKKDDSSKIGQFGTGLKYAISYLVRNNVKFRLFIGKDEVKFTSKKEDLRGQEFDVIYCNDRSMNITTEYGYQWKAWEAIREIWCNAKDESKFNKSVKGENAVISGEPNWTTFFIEMTEEVKSVVDNWGNYFVNSKPLFENDKLAVFENTDKSNMRIYKNGVRISELSIPSLFHYDIKEAQLNELRQYMDNPSWKLPSLLLDTNSEVISKYLSFLLKNEQKDQKIFEGKLDWSWCFNRPSNDVIKKNFSGFMFIHPDSTISGSGRVIKVNKELFEILNLAGLPCEKVVKSSGRSFGGSYGSGDTPKFKLMNDERLHERISSIYQKRGINIKFETAIPFEKDFEFVSEYNKLIFSVDLFKLSDSDLEAVLLIAYVNNKEGDIYKSFKRLLKSNLNNQYLQKILINEE